MAQGENALKLALGEKRYAEYRLLHDERYREAYAEAQKAGARKLRVRFTKSSSPPPRNRRASRKKPVSPTNNAPSNSSRPNSNNSEPTPRRLARKIRQRRSEPAPKPVPAKIHIVANGEGLDRIARIYAVQPNDLRAANPGLNFNKLKAGDKVSVPYSLLFPIPAAARTVSHACGHSAGLLRQRRHRRQTKAAIEHGLLILLAMEAADTLPMTSNGFPARLFGCEFSMIRTA